MNRNFATRDCLRTSGWFRRTPTLSVLVGLPRSGKSTWANKNYRRLRATIVSGDDVRRALGINRFDPKQEPEVQRILKIMVEALLLRGQDVIIDETNHTKFRRLRWVGLAAGGFCQLHYVQFDHPSMEEWRQRCKDSGFPWPVVYRKERQFQCVMSWEMTGKNPVLEMAEK
jgi:predicted kinase